MVAQYHKSRDALYEGQFDDKMKNLQRGGEGIIAVSYEAKAQKGNNVALSRNDECCSFLSGPTLFTVSLI